MHKHLQPIFHPFSGKRMGEPTVVVVAPPAPAADVPRRRIRKQWWSLSEIAAARLPGMPRCWRGVQRLAKREGWKERRGQVRRRKGRGGGCEYHYTLLPAWAQVALLERGL